MTRNKMNDVVARRGELLAELFFQDLNPEFIARPTGDFAYDFLIGFPNPKGGINNIAVEVKATESLIRNQYPISKHYFERFANSNVPVLLLVVDVKANRLFYAWFTPDLPHVVANTSEESNWTLAV